MEKYYLISIWIAQAILYSLLTFKVVNWQIKRRYILIVAIILSLTAPWLLRIDEDFQCGMSFFIPISIYWFLGNAINFILFFGIVGLGKLLKKKS